MSLYINLNIGNNYILGDYSV